MAEKITDKIVGYGKDTFDTIMFNQHRTMRIGGDSYAEIITTKRRELRNLKPLNPGTIKLIADGFGLINRYEQWINGEIHKTFNPDDILHLTINR